jgi:hypothetical protein
MEARVSSTVRTFLLREGIPVSAGLEAGRDPKTILPIRQEDS